MTDKRPFFENLMHRRVPQIVGMYVAATGLVIELGDWVTERFNLPTMLTSYIFVAMLVMLPAIVLFAYNHGAPGADEWTKSERVVIPLNAVLGLVLLYFLGPLLPVEAATEDGRVRNVVLTTKGANRLKKTRSLLSQWLNQHFTDVLTIRN